MGELERALLLKVKKLERKIERQEKLIEKYKYFAKRVQDAEVWEYAIYDEIPDDTWIALDHENYIDIMKALADVDKLQPWKSTLERRMGSV